MQYRTLQRGYKYLIPLPTALISGLAARGSNYAAIAISTHRWPTTTARYDRRPEVTKKRAAGTLHVPVIRWQPASSLAAEEGKKERSKKVYGESIN